MAKWVSVYYTFIEGGGTRVSKRQVTVGEPFVLPLDALNIMLHQEDSHYSYDTSCYWLENLNSGGLWRVVGNTKEEAAPVPDVNGRAMAILNEEWNSFVANASKPPAPTTWELDPPPPELLIPSDVYADYPPEVFKNPEVCKFYTPQSFDSLVLPWGPEKYGLAEKKGVDSVRALQWEDAKTALQARAKRTVREWPICTHGGKVALHFKRHAERNDTSDSMRVICKASWLCKHCEKVWHV